MSKPVTAIVVGAGGRGSTYALFAKEHPERMQMVGVAEPRDFYRQRLVETYAIPAENVFTDWRGWPPARAWRTPSSSPPRTPCTPNRRWPSPGWATPCCWKSPWRPTRPTAARIVAGGQGQRHPLWRVPRAALHALHPGAQSSCSIRARSARWSASSISNRSVTGTRRIPSCAATGATKPRSSSMLLAKSCHDLDWLRYVMGDALPLGLLLWLAEALPPRPKARRGRRGQTLPGLRLRAAAARTRPKRSTWAGWRRARPAGRWTWSPPTPTARER